MIAGCDFDIDLVGNKVVGSWKEDLFRLQGLRMLEEGNRWL